MSEKIVVKSSGISVAGLLGVVFVTLKLTGYIAWSWVWVLAPFWMPLVILAIVLIAIFGFGVLIGLLKMLLKK